MTFYRHYVLYDKLEITQEHNGNLHKYVCNLEPTENFKPFKNHNAYIEFLDKCLSNTDNAYCYITVGGNGLSYLDISFWFENDLFVIEHDLKLSLISPNNQHANGFECVADYKITQNMIAEHNYIEISACNIKTNQLYFDNITLPDIQKQNKNWNVEIATKFIADCLENKLDGTDIQVWKRNADSLAIHFVAECNTVGGYLSVSLRQIA